MRFDGCVMLQCHYAAFASDSLKILIQKRRILSNAVLRLIERVQGNFQSVVAIHQVEKF
ncbi:MAG: hypothetical protein LH647_01575 [Leptolyngbyaceae cyanobacterium CAN_BIN12]|nr:hypothetical protein [Leptolyngbyaceae cyanobacterium CAN_BIN12]